MSVNKLESRLDLAFFLFLACSFFSLWAFETEWIGRLSANLAAFLLLTVYLLLKCLFGFRRIIKGKCVNKYKGGIAWTYAGNLSVLAFLIFVILRFTFPVVSDALILYNNGVEGYESELVVDSLNSFFGARFIYQSVNFHGESETYFMFQNTPILRKNQKYTVVIAPSSGLILQAYVAR